MRYMTQPTLPELEKAPELAVMSILDHNLKSLDDALFATDRNLIEDCDFWRQDAYTASIHIARAILDHSEALRLSFVAYQKTVKASENQKTERKYNSIF
jgi:hypothetical protein